MKDSSLLPCATCPWRIDQTVDVIPNYIHDKACGLMDTVGRGDDFRPIMACHGSTERKMFACKGYLAREGWSNLNVRFLMLEDNIASPSKVAEACKRAGIQLHEDYPSVLDKLGKR